MIRQEELDRAIAEMEAAPVSFQNLEKLAVFYAIRDHGYNNTTEVSYAEKTPEKPPDSDAIVCDDGTDFAASITGKKFDDIFPILSEIMQTLQALQPRVYDAAIQKLREI